MAEIGGDATEVKQFNELLEASGFDVRVALLADKFETERAGATYPAEQMSNGERAAFLLAGEVLTAAASVLVLLDEPELHLHPSISAPLLRRLFLLRVDCAFVVFTHDMALPGRQAHVVVLRSCRFDANGTTPVFHADALEPGEDLPEQLRQDILGARVKILRPRRRAV